MNVGAILIGIAILVVTVPFMISPVVNQRKKLAAESVSPKRRIEDQEKNILAALRDLDFDFQTGKITREDYDTLRPQLVAEAAGYLQMKQQEEENIEALIRLRSEKMRAQAPKTTVPCDQCAGEIRPQDTFCPKCGAPVKKQEGSVEQDAPAFCPHCGRSVKAKDRYCISCGHPLSVQPTLAQNTTANN